MVSFLKKERFSVALVNFVFFVAISTMVRDCSSKMSIGLSTATTLGLGNGDIDMSLPYEQIFDKGYVPFNDLSELAPEKAAILAHTERCNIMFADYLEKNKLQLTKSPPGLPTKVSIMLIVTNIYEVNEKDQTVTLTMFIEISWRDRRLLNAVDESCGDVSYTIPNFAQIWFPVWTIENSAERTLYNEAWEKFPAVIHNRSVVVWITSFRIVINCPMKMEAFPFDAQNCYFMIRSPHYLVTELQYFVYGPDQAILLWNENVSHPLWKVTGQLARAPSTNVSGIELWFRLERKPTFYIWTLVIPTSLISISTFLAFLLPSHSSEKVQTMLTGILAYFLLMLTLTEVTPQASDSIPILTLFFVVLIAMGIFGSLVCAAIVRVATTERQNQRPVNPTLNRRLNKPTSCRQRWLPSEILNDSFLFIYIGCVAGSYVWLMISTEFARARGAEEDAQRLNYTPIQMF